MIWLIICKKAGVRFAADINAYTSFDEMVYQLSIPSNKPGNTERRRGDHARSGRTKPCLILWKLTKNAAWYWKKKRLGKGAGERMQRVYWPVLLNNSRYAVRVPIGLDTVLDNFKRPTIARFYKDWYRPDLQALIIVGDINADSLEKVVRATFSDLKNPVHERVRTKYTVPLDDKNHFIAVTDKEMTSDRSRGYHQTSTATIKDGRGLPECHHPGAVQPNAGRTLC